MKQSQHRRGPQRLADGRVPLQFVCAALGLFALSSCGPIYDTQYRFSPPTSSGGQACIYQCENSKGQCGQLEQYRSDDCQRRAEYEQQRCEADIWRRKGREPKWYECGTESCSANEDRCEQQYRSCYQSCGGRVDSQTVCVANCDQIPQQGANGSGNVQGSVQGNSGTNGGEPYYTEDYRDKPKKPKPRKY